MISYGGSRVASSATLMPQSALPRPSAARKLEDGRAVPANFNLQAQLLECHATSHIPLGRQVSQCKLASPVRLSQLAGGRLVSRKQFSDTIRHRKPSCRNRDGNGAITATATPRDIESSSTLQKQHESDTDFSSALLWIDAFWRFTRPHTMIGTTLSVFSVSLLAMDATTGLSVPFIAGLLKAVVPALLMNIYIVGLNQLSDIEIDKVNKPYLPLASGEFSVGMGVSIVSIAAIMSLAMGVASGSTALLLTLLVSMILGTAYSIDLPGLRWKRFPLVAAGCILAVRAVVVQLGFFFHMKFALNRAAVLSRQLLFATSFMCLFSVVIALFKDIPDAEGDRRFGVFSFTVQLGQQKVFWFCITTLLAAYGGALLFGLTCSTMWSKVITTLAHSTMALLLWQRAQAADLTDKDSIYETYMFVWKLFYAEYLLLPFFR